MGRYHYITAASHERYGVTKIWSLGCLFNTLLKLTSTQHQTPHCWPFLIIKPLVPREFPHRTSNALRFHVMTSSLWEDEIASYKGTTTLPTSGPLPQSFCLVTVMHYELCMTWFLWYYYHYRISWVLSGDLVPIWHQDIYEHGDDVGRSSVTEKNSVVISRNKYVSWKKYFLIDNFWRSLMYLGE